MTGTMMIANNPQQLQLFSERLPRKPYCTDDFECGLQIRPARTAIRKRYVQVNPPWLRSFIVMDVDRPGAALAWDDADLPMPFWSSMNPENGHAHLSWAINAPVLLGQHDRQRPMRYLAAIEGAMREKLQADPGYSGLITKNPANTCWRTLWAPENAGIYDLDYLDEFLDLKKHRPHKRPETVGLGRNCDTFDWLRHYAYKEIRLWRGETPPPGHSDRQGVFVHWLNHLYQRSLHYTHDSHPNPLDHRECHHIAKSVATWVWNKFDLAASDQLFSEKQAARGSRASNQAEIAVVGGIASGKARKAVTEEKRASAMLMRAKGMTQAEIAQALGVTDRTVRNWLNC